MSRYCCPLHRNYVALLLSEVLKERNHQLDLWGLDRKVLCIGYRDLMNYLKFHWRIFGQGSPEPKLREKLCNYIHEKPSELREFVHLWSGVWMKKWNERARLLIGDEDLECWRRTRELIRKAEPVWWRLKNRDEITDLVIDALIRNGEICGTPIIAENMLKIQLGLCIERKIGMDKHERLLEIVNKVLKDVRRISRSKGPLILIRVDKSFFQRVHRPAH